MSLSYVKVLESFAVFFLFCCLLRNDDGSACLLYYLIKYPLTAASDPVIIRNCTEKASYPSVLYIAIQSEI